MSSVTRQISLAVVISLAITATASASGIVINGSFESPVVTDSHKWDIYSSITGWRLVRGPSIELHRGVNGWTSAAGNQHMELDSDIDGPGGSLNGEAASSAVYQDLGTAAGQQYELTFAYSPRPGVADNQLEVKWDGQVQDTLAADGSGRSNTDWTYHSYVVTAASDTTRLEFGDRSKSDSLGTFLDDVSVTAIPEPASVFLLLGGVVAGLSRRLA